MVKADKQKKNKAPKKHTFRLGAPLVEADVVTLKIPDLEGFSKIAFLAISGWIPMAF